MNIFNTICDIRDTRYEKGAALLFTLMVMIVLTSMVGAYLGFVHSSTRSTGAQISDSQAIYLADAGIHYGIYSLKQDSSWRGTSLPVSLGEGTFSVSVADSDSVPDLGEGDYRLTSTGTVDDQSRTVQQDVTLTTAWHSAFDYAIYGNDVSDTLDLKDDVTINGHLYYDYSSGTVDIQDNASVNNDYYVYADSVSGDGIQAPSAPDPVPTFPTLDTTSYTGAGGVITNFDSDISDYDISSTYLGYTGAWTADPDGTVNITLSGNILYYENFKAKNNSTITGYGTIVSDGEVKLENTTSVTPSGGTITIISRKKMEIKDSATVQANTILYARGEDKKGSLKEEFKVKDSATISSSTLLSSNKLKVEGGTVSASTMYVPSVGDTIEISGSSTTVSNSTLLSRKKIEIKGAATVDSDSVLYLTSDGSEIKVKDDNTSVDGSILMAVYYILSDGSILSNSKFKMEGGATFTGIIFAFEAELKGDSIINGAVVADTYKNDEIKENVIINYNRSYFPDSIPTGLETGETTIVPKTDTWNEI